jgi:hypothetical protein
MRKLAVFVEGYTELLFVNQLVEKIAGPHRVIIEQQKIRGGKKVGRTISVISAAKPNTGQQYYVLIMDCGGDKAVKNRVIEEHEKLTQAGYMMIIGMRDVRPDITYADIPKLEAGLRMYVKTSLIPVVFILSVMEIEAWFLSEFNHFSKIDPSITVPTIRATLGFDPEHDDMAQRPTPTDDLINCYQIGGKTYKKNNAADTVAALDYPFLYLELQKKIEYIKRLTDAIDGFLA